MTADKVARMTPSASAHSPIWSSRSWAKSNSSLTLADVHRAQDRHCVEAHFEGLPLCFHIRTHRLIPHPTNGAAGVLFSVPEAVANGELRPLRDPVDEA